MKAILATNLTKYYGKSRGILDVSLSVEEGDFFGFIGPNGAGKSTTIRILLRLITATKGSAQIFGQDIQKSRNNILADIGYLPSEIMFYGGIKVGIVCAMQHQPRLYILDEPTSGLDPLMQREFYSLLKEKNAKGATIFLSSHILSEV